MLAALFFLQACENPNQGLFDPRLVTDTVEVAPPLGEESPLPTALNITATPAGVVGGVFPEIPDTQWDLLIRQETETGLVFVPPGAVGFDSRAGISEPVTTQAFDQIDEVPSGTEFITDRSVAVQTVHPYLVRSRGAAQGGTSGCSQFAKMLVLSVAADSTPPVLTLEITTNGQCGDQRLAEE